MSTEILRLTLKHDYFEPSAPPISVVPTDIAFFEAEGFLLRQSNQNVSLVIEDESVRPRQTSLFLVAQSPDLLNVTRGAEVVNQQTILNVVAPLDLDVAGLETASALTLRRTDRSIVQCDIDLPTTGMRHLTLHFKATKSFWAYYIIGAGLDSDLKIQDSDGRVFFEDKGQETLPNRQTARVFQSIQEIPARQNPNHKFALLKVGALGSETVMPALPSAGLYYQKMLDENGDHVLMSQIYTYLP